MSMVEWSWQVLDPARRRAGLSVAALYLRYLELGGVASSAQLAAYLQTGVPLPALDHDVAVHAINERFFELRDPERVPYQADAAPT
jgi:hypothetical protein